jgi:hypothetical protein
MQKLCVPSTFHLRPNQAPDCVKTLYALSLYSIIFLQDRGGMLDERHRGRLPDPTAPVA